MELPKNITQIGEVNQNCRIYVEDYVMSYIKQLNGQALDREKAAALYGLRKEEEGITYLFFYGACKLDFLQRETRHLSQAVLQEAEKARKKHFSEYTFLGYSLLNGEMVEGFHVYEQGVCRYVAGFAQFYEKNDSMLKFMLAERQGEVRPEEVDQEKYEVVKRRQEERRLRAEEERRRKRGYAWQRETGNRERIQNAHRDSNMGMDRDGHKYGAKKEPDTRLRQMKLTAAAVFAVLCVAGLTMMNGSVGLGELQAAIRQMMEDASSRQLPDAVEVSNGSAQVGTIVAEDKLADAILKENQAVQESETSEEAQQASGSASSAPSPEPTPDSASTPTPDPTPTPTPTPDPTPEPTPDPVPEASQEPVSYIIQKGDTLIGICMKKYGSDARVAEVCSLNNISNPDDIKVGEKILLPQP